MAKTHFKGTEINTNGNLPVVGSVAPNFTLVKGDLSDGSLSTLYIKGFAFCTGQVLWCRRYRKCSDVVGLPQ